MHLLSRAVSAALLGALTGAAALVGFAAWRSTVAFDMSRDLPSYVSGFYPGERDGLGTFAWTHERAQVKLDGADRRVPWTCAVRFRGARPTDADQPDLTIAIDGLIAGSWRATNAFQDVVVTVPVSPSKPGLVLSLTSSRVFEPGPSDPRKLGVQVYRVGCAPESGVMLPPRRALGAAAASAAVLGAGFALTGITAGAAIGSAALMAVGQAFLMLTEGGLYGGYPSTAPPLAAAIAAPLVLFIGLVRVSRKKPLRNTARFVLVFSAGALYLQLLALLHPAKPLVDALFHAHRFDAVLAGRWYFTQLSTSATPFPYAIGLYLFSIPWAFLTANHVALLRVVVSSAEIVAGALLYLAVIRAWGDRLTGAIATALFAMMPISYEVIGNANLTHAFGQATAIVTVTLVAIQAERLRRPATFAAVCALATLALISHVSTLVLLPSTLVVVAALFWMLGGKRLRGASSTLVVATILALVLGTVIYWGHFGDVYRAQFQRMGTAVSSASAPEATADAGSLAQAPLRGLGRRTLPLHERAVMAAEQLVRYVGWPILVFAAAGAWRLFRERGRDPLTLVVVAWALTLAAYVAVSVLSTGNRAYQQDAYEFISRVIHTTLPAVALLAARGAAWGWGNGRAARAATSVGLAWAVFLAVRAWAGWLA